MFRTWRVQRSGEDRRELAQDMLSRKAGGGDLSGHQRGLGSRHGQAF